MENEKVALYIRVSTAEQGKGFSLEAQEKELQEYVMRRNLRVFKTYIDKSSGLVLDRDKLQELLDDAEQMEFSKVLITETDRISRDPELTGYLKITLANRNIALTAINEPEQEDSDIEALTKHIMAAVSKFEIQRKNRRTERGRALARQNNKFMNRPPYGYEMKDGQITVNPEQAAKVFEIFRFRLLGYRPFRIAHELKIANTTVRRILANKFYHDPTYNGKHETIISATVFEEANKASLT